MLQQQNKLDLSRVLEFQKVETENTVFKIVTPIDTEYHSFLLEKTENYLKGLEFSEQDCLEILFIMSQNYSHFHAMYEVIGDASECAEPLIFLKSYLETLEFQNKVLKKKRAPTKLYESPYLEIVFPNLSLESKIRLPYASHYIKNIFKAVKTLSPALSELLSEYQEIPSLKIIKKLADNNDRILNYVDNYLIPITYFDLDSYLNKYHAKKVSRKTGMIIFNLLRFFGYFNLESKDDTENFKIDYAKFRSRNIEEHEVKAYLKKIKDRYRSYLKDNL